MPAPASGVTELGIRQAQRPKSPEMSACSHKDRQGPMPRGRLPEPLLPWAQRLRAGKGPRQERTGQAARRDPVKARRVGSRVPTVSQAHAPKARSHPRGNSYQPGERKDSLMATWLLRISQGLKRLTGQQHKPHRIQKPRAASQHGLLQPSPGSFQQWGAHHLEMPRWLPRPSLPQRGEARPTACGPRGSLLPAVPPGTER